MNYILGYGYSILKIVIVVLTAVIINKASKYELSKSDYKSLTQGLKIASLLITLLASYHTYRSTLTYISAMGTSNSFTTILYVLSNVLIIIGGVLMFNSANKEDLNSFITMSVTIALLFGTSEAITLLRIMPHLIYLVDVQVGFYIIRATEVTVVFSTIYVVVTGSRLKESIKSGQSLEFNN